MRWSRNALCKKPESTPTIPSVERGQGAPRKVLGIMFGGRCLVKLQTIAVVKRMLAGSSEGLLT